MPYHETQGFRGVNLRRDRLSLGDEELAKAINADLFSVFDAIRPRRGRRLVFADALSDLAVRMLYKNQGFRYQIAGTSIYRDAVKIVDGALSTRLFTSAMAYRPLNDSKIWAFFADAGVMRKDDGARTYKWGIDAPTLAPAVREGVESSLTGTYSARQTYVRFDGASIAHESNPSPASEGLDLSENSLCLGDMLHPTDAQIGGFGIYRTVNGGVDHLLDQRLPFPEIAYGVTYDWEVSLLPNGLIHQWTRPFNFTPAAGGSSSLPTKYPTATANNTSVGTKGWNNKPNVGASDDVRARFDDASNRTSYYLVATGFGFAIPSTATITGVEVEIEIRKSGGNGSVKDNRVRIVKGGTIGSTDKANTSDWPAVDTWRTYGGSADLWGETWTPADINNSNFGVAISAVITYLSGTAVSADIDAIRITVYTAGDSSVSAFSARCTWETGDSGWEGTASEDPEGRQTTCLAEIAEQSITQTKRWAYHSNLADLGLGTAVEIDNNPPPLAASVAQHMDSTFLARDPANPHYLWWSKRFRPEAFPVANFVEVGSAADPLQVIVPFAGLLGAFARQTKYRVLGSDSSGFVAQEALSHRGTPSPGSVAVTDRGILFAARDGVFLTNLISPDEPLARDILPLFYGETVNGYEPINWAVADTISAGFYKRRFYLAYPAGDSPTPNMVAVYSVDTEKWYFYALALRSFFVEEDVDDFTVGGLDGFIYRLEEGRGDNNESYTMTIETKDYAPERNVKKLFRFFKVDADTDGETLTASLLIDGVVKGQATITGNRTKALHRVNAGAMGHSWRLSLSYTGTKQPRIYGAAVEYLNLGPS